MKKKLLALVLATAMTLSLASCGGSKTETPSTGSDNSSASSDNFSAEGATYKVGICQLVQHPALDAATQGFIDALNEALPGLKTRTPPARPTTAVRSSTALFPRAWT